MINLLKRIGSLYKIIIVLLDLALINIAYILAFLIKFGSLPERNFISYLQAAPFITIAALIYFDVFGMLKFYGKTVYETVSSILFVVFLIGVTATAITYFNQGYAFPRSILLITPVIQIILLSIWKVFLLKIRRYILGAKSAMIIGNISASSTSIDKVKAAMEQDNVVIKYIYSSDESAKIFKRINTMDEVFICDDIPNELKMKIISHCIGGRQIIYVIPQLFEISLSNSKLTQFYDIPAFMIGKLDLSIEQKFFKRLFDLGISFTGMILSIPLVLIIIPLIRLTSQGPVLYTQERVTKNNRIFKIYKFRTMYVGAEDETGPVLSSGKNDPRVTKAGSILRKLRLDELPQLLNVLKGEMSIVGPRPERPCFVEEFCESIPEYSHRYAVKAGVTGYAQVLGYYNTSAEDKLRYDLIYIKNYSLLLDIKLMLQTIKVMFVGNMGNDKVIAASFNKGKKHDKLQNKEHAVRL